MAPLPSNSTARYKWFYTVGGHQHTAQVRVLASFTPEDMGTFLSAWYDALGGSLYNGVIDEVQFAQAGSDIFNPVVTGVEGQAFGSGGAGGQADAPKYLDFVGRGSSGRRVRLAQFGVIGVAGDFRYTSAESPAIADAVGLLNGTDGLGLTVSGNKAIWKPYANSGYNAYWQREVRS